MNKNSEQQTESKTLGWSYGGQALIEGILMRGKYIAAIAVRKADGEIVIKEESLSGLYRGVFSKVPFLRGIPLLWDSLGLGMKALFFSAEVLGQEEDPEFSLEGGWGIATGAVSLLVGVGLFMVLPSLVAGWLIKNNVLLSNIVEGLIRLILLVGYMAIIGQMEEIKRVFAYHGAEHKTINTHEAGLPLTVENVRQQSRQHPRCGTAFLLVVVLISILVFTPMGKMTILLRITTRLIFLPVIAGISYEVLRFTGKHSENKIIRALIAPNLALQNLTTREPDDEMLEVAISALNAVLQGEQRALQTEAAAN